MAVENLRIKCKYSVTFIDTIFLKYHLSFFPQEAQSSVNFDNLLRKKSPKYGALVTR